MKPEYRQDDDGSMYSPQYDDWNNEKQYINFEKIKKLYPEYKESDIWWINIGLNIGKEIYGKGEDFRRPVLIIKKMGNMFLGIPLTSQNKDGIPGFFQVIYRNKTSSWAILSQLRVFSAYRLLHKHNEVGKVSGKILETIKLKIKEFYNL